METIPRGETKRTDPTPFHPNNRLVSVQYNTCQDLEPKFVWFYHEKKKPDLPVAIHKFNKY